MACPFCGKDDIDISCATDIGYDGDIEVTGFSPGNDIQLYGDELIQKGEYLFKAVCNNCKKEFYAELRSPFDSYSLLDAGYFVRVEFAENGFPQKFAFGLKTFTVKEMFHYKQLFKFHYDELFGSPPFGTFFLLTDCGRCELEVSPKGMSLEPEYSRPIADIISCYVAKADKWLRNNLKEMEEDNFKYLDSKLPRKHDFKNDEEYMAALDKIVKQMNYQRLESRFLPKAAFSIVRKTEVLIRQHIWHHLEEKYSSKGINWWKEILPNYVLKDIVEASQKRGDREFRLNPPRDYLGLGHLPEIVKEKWNDFKDYFPPQELILLQLKNLGNCRNDIMHARPLTFEQYEELRKLAEKLVEAFAPTNNKAK